MIIFCHIGLLALAQNKKSSCSIRHLLHHACPNNSSNNYFFFNQILYRSTLLVDPNFFFTRSERERKKVMHFGSSLLGVKACSILSGCHDQRAANLVCQVHFCKLLNQSKHLGRTSLNCLKGFTNNCLNFNLKFVHSVTKKNIFLICRHNKYFNAEAKGAITCI